MADIEPLDGEAAAADVDANGLAYATGVCPSCGQEIPPERLEMHLAGLDGARPECARQDLVEIAQRARAAELWYSPDNFWRRALWEKGYR